jgi:hypothetical protein
MHSRKLRKPMETVNHAGRGSEPMIDVGNMIPSEALNITGSFAFAFRSRIKLERKVCGTRRRLMAFPGTGKRLPRACRIARFA